MRPWIWSHVDEGFTQKRTLYKKKKQKKKQKKQKKTKKKNNVYPCMNLISSIYDVTASHAPY